MTAIVIIGIDLAKNVFAVHGVDATGKPTLVRPSVPRTKLSRAQMAEPGLSAMNGHCSACEAVVQCGIEGGRRKAFAPSGCCVGSNHSHPLYLANAMAN